MAEQQKTQFVGEKDAVARPASKVTVFEIKTGRATEVWPIDARELVQSGHYSHTAPAPLDDGAIAAAREAAARAALEEAERQALAREQRADAERQAAEAEAKALGAREAEAKAAELRAAADAAAAAGSGSTETPSTDAPPAGDPSPASDAKPAIVPDASKTPVSTSRRANRS